jgi:hypothetical protein
VTQHDPRWLLDEAWRQVGRASTAEDTARALSTFRRAIATAQKHAGATPVLLERVRQLEQAADELYAGQQDEHVRKAIRALASLRMAMESRLAAGAGNRTIAFAGAELDAERVERFYRLPVGILEGGRSLSVKLSIDGTPRVRVYGPRGGFVWGNEGASTSRTRRAPAWRKIAPSGHHRAKGAG